MERTITQRELRNDNAEIMRALENGETFIITRNGVPVGRLTPVPRRTFVPAKELKQAFARLPRVEYPRVSEHARALLDTSVVVDIDLIDEGRLPDECSIATITLAELSAGLHAVADSAQRAARQVILQYVESTFQSVPFDSEAARAYGRIYAAVRAAGKKPRGGRAVDLFIAATALSRALPLFTRNSVDFTTVANLVEIVSV